MNSVVIPEDILKTKYIKEHKPIWLVAEELGVAVGTVYNYLKKYGIQTRKMSDYPATEKQRDAWRKIGKSKKGKKLSDESKLKISKAHTNGGIGHKKKRSDGYIAIYFPDHPMSNNDGYIMEHVLVMEAIVGRHLTENECVHHKNFNRADNRKENLQLMTKSEHMSYHSKLRHQKRRNDLSTQ